MRDEYRVECERMRTEGFASPRVAMTTASSSVLEHFDTKGHVPLSVSLYPADDAVSLIKMCIQALKIHPALSSLEPSSAATVNNTWRNFFAKKAINLGCVVNDITTRRDVIDSDSLRRQVDAALVLAFDMVPN